MLAENQAIKAMVGEQIKKSYTTGRYPDIDPKI